MRKFREQLSSLHSCMGEEGTAVASSQSISEQVSVTFGDSSDLRVGKIFASREEAANMISIIAMKGNFTFKKCKKSMELLVRKCSVAGCSWAVHCRKMGKSKEFEVQTYVVNTVVGLIVQQRCIRMHRPM